MLAIANLNATQRSKRPNGILHHMLALKLSIDFNLSSTVFPIFSLFKGLIGEHSSQNSP